MNRIVIIGNGFDLAHGLSTRYEDFILSLINKAVDDLNNQVEYSEIYQQLFTLKKNPQNNLKIQIFKSLFELKNDSTIFKSQNFQFFRDKYFTKELWTTSHTMSITINSKLFQDLFSKQNWTDIEKGYFEILSTIYKNQNEQISSSNDLKKLNSDFEFLKELFIEFIKENNIEISEFNTRLKHFIETCTDDEDLYECYRSSVRKKEIKSRYVNPKLEKTIFVNFNYTSVLENYIKFRNFKQFDYSIIPIHGQIFNKQSIVFGYGDEMTEYYKKLENLDDKNVLKHFKSHYYHSNDNYAKLLFEVENFEFDVVVFGHSLGLSDRLLLNTIFENENCKAIHLFHSGGESHFKKRIALSRHFDDKKAFRKKLMEENEYLKVERKKNTNS